MFTFSVHIVGNECPLSSQEHFSKMCFVGIFLLKKTHNKTKKDPRGVQTANRRDVRGGRSERSTVRIIMAEGAKIVAEARLCKFEHVHTNSQCTFMPFLFLVVLSL